MKDLVKLVVALGLPQIVGITAGLANAEATALTYPALEKPWFAPPGWVFGPVWTLLYLLMGVAFFLVWKVASEVDGARLAMALFLIQLALNGAWTFIFFGLGAPGLALIEITILLAAVTATGAAFYRVRAVAGLLLVPYWLWVAFATLLNLSLWWLNS